MEHLVFVYGSLKPGYYNHHVIKGCKTLSTEAITVDSYSMISLGSFPGVLEQNKTKLIDNVWVKDKNFTGQVRGVLIQVTDKMLRTLDILESNGYFYERKRIYVYDSLLEDIVLPAWCYFLIPRLNKFDYINVNVNNYLEWRQ